MLVLIQGPPGAGKADRAEQLLDRQEVDLVADFTRLLAAVTNVDMLDPETGLYPVRPQAMRAHDAQMSVYLKRAAVRQGLRQGLNVAVTAGQRKEELYREIVEAENPNARFKVETLDPGRQVAEERLIERSRDDSLTDMCVKALNKWYGKRR